MNLYLFIPRVKGGKACRAALEMRQMKRMPTGEALEMIDTVLDNNVIHFKEKNYQQKKCVAIGSKLGKNYARAYMKKYDE